MGTKWCSTGVLDSMFAYLYTKTGNLRLVVTTSSDILPTITACSSGQTSMLAQSTNDAFPGTSYFTIANSGENRICTISACCSDTVRNTGIASYVCLIEDSSSIRYITTCTTQDLTVDNKVNIGTWTITINQPTP